VDESGERFSTNEGEEIAYMYRHRSSAERPEAKIPLGKFRSRWEDALHCGLLSMKSRMLRVVVAWTQLAEDWG
jgi:hypothetical protein